MELVKLKVPSLLSAFKTLRYLRTSIKDKMVSIAVEKFTEVTSTVKTNYWSLPLAQASKFKLVLDQNKK